MFPKATGPRISTLYSVVIAKTSRTLEVGSFSEHRWKEGNTAVAAKLQRLMSETEEEVRDCEAG